MTYHQSGPAIDPVTLTLADTMRRKISGDNKWDQQLEGYLQNSTEVGRADPSPTCTPYLGRGQEATQLPRAHRPRLCTRTQ